MSDLPENPRRKGVELIAETVKNLPGSPGVYRMLNTAGDALYVGKAKNLKKRVVNYTQPDKNTIRIQRMIAETAAMEFTTTHTEAEALLLEANLIKKLKPRYNILLRDDKSFPYILIAGNHAFPQVTKHRGAKDQKGEYFGPFASGYAVNAALATLQRAFLLRNCSDHVFALRTRPCLQYQIKRCTAPCVGKVDEKAYAAQVDMARQFLNGQSRAIQESFAVGMQQASADMRYEDAAAYRDRIRALTQIQMNQNIHVEGLDSVDLHAMHQEHGQTCVQVFFFRAGQSYGNRAYFPRHAKDDAPADILSAFVAQFYTNKPVPREILVNTNISAQDVMEEALKEKAGYKVTITKPQRGQKAELIANAEKNAAQALAHHMATEAENTTMLERLSEVFGLDGTPERIEIFDNSHISGTDALGAMVVATAEGWQKNSYRKFNIKDSGAAGDDFAMMREMLTRRFAKVADDATLPDVVLIDGGLGQLNAALQVLADSGHGDIPVIAIAKGPDRNAGRERFFMQGKEPLQLQTGDPLLYFLQRLRDEAHRFAITSHRSRRSRKIGETGLEAIAGIGGKRKKALLMHFGSAKAVAEAGIPDLQQVPGISQDIAQKIYNFFHDG